MWHTADEGVTTVTSFPSSDLTTWSRTNLLAPVSGQADPVGGNGAWLITENGINGSHSLLAAGYVNRQSGDGEVDIYFKRSSGTRNVAVGTSSTNATLVNLSDGTFTPIGGGTNPAAYAVVTDAGGGWYRLRMLISNTAVSAITVYLTNSATSVGSYTGDGTSGILAYSSNQWHRQRLVSSWLPKDGSVLGASVQATAGNQATLISDGSLGFKNTVGCTRAITKNLTDDPAVAALLSGTDKPFTFCWVGRTTLVGAGNIFRFAGATASHNVLSTTSTSRLSISRTDDASSTVTPIFSAEDFTADRNWHQYAIVFAGTTCELWVDGFKTSTTFSMDVGLATFTSLVTTFDSFYWRERAIYSRALSPAELSGIQTGMLSRAGLPTPDLESPLNVPGIQGWWSADFGINLSQGTVDPDLIVPGWTKTNVTVTQSGGVYSMNEAADAGSVAHQLTFITTSTVAGLGKLTVEAKMGTRRWISLTGDGTNARAWFDLQLGVVGSQVSCTGTIVDLGGGWYRCSIEFTINGSNVNIFATNVNNALNYQSLAPGVALEIRNVTRSVQDRVGSWFDRTLARWLISQASSSTQPMFASSTFYPSQRINSLPSVYINNLQKSLNNTGLGLGAIFNGADRPISTLTLSRIDLANVALGAPVGWHNNSTTAFHYAMGRNTSGGLWTTTRKDDAAVTVSLNYGAVALGTQTLSEVFSGTTGTMFVNGVQLGTGPIDVGTITGPNWGALFIAQATREIILSNRQLTSTERVALETGEKRRSGLI
jgi:hypothetical protein